MASAKAALVALAIIVLLTALWMVVPAFVKLINSLETELSIELAMLDAFELPLGPEAESDDSTVPTAAVMAGTGSEVLLAVTVLVLSLLPLW